MFGNERSDLIQTLAQMSHEAIHRTNNHQEEAKKLFEGFLSNDKRFKQFDAQRLSDRVWKCRSDGSRIDLSDPYLHGK